MINWLLGLVFVFFLFGRIFPYFGNTVPLGYDPGLYLYLFKQYSHLPFLAFNHLLEWLLQMFQSGIPVIARILTIFVTPEKILVPLIITSQILLFVSIFLLAKKLWNEKAALWTVFIFASSAIQFRFYWYYYLKNAFALSFLFFTFYFLLSSSYWAIPFTILVLYFHQQTAVFLLAALFILLIVRKGERRYLAIVLGASLAAAAPYYLTTFNQSLQPLIKPILAGFLPQNLGGTLGLASGTFYSLDKALLLSLPYLPFGIWGLYLMRSQKKIFFLAIPIVLALIIAFFGFFLSRRFIPFLDLFLILFAGYGAAEFFKRKRVLSFVYIILMITFISTFINKTGAPLILDDELKEIKMLSETEPQSYVLVTDQAYTPWVYGWSDRQTIAPGFGENDIYWTIPQWHQFWESGSREIEHDLLLKLPKPLYIYHGDRRQNILTDFSGLCFEKVNWRTYKFICE